MILRVRARIIRFITGSSSVLSQRARTVYMHASLDLARYECVQGWYNFLSNFVIFLKPRLSSSSHTSAVENFLTFTYVDAAERAELIHSVKSNGV